MAPAICLGADLSSGEVCRNNSGEVWGLQVISMVVIFLTSLIGISSPVILSRIIYGRTNHESVVLLIKCFSAGVILSTSLVHVLPDAYNAMGDCDVSTRHPWRDFPFAGLVCAIGALLALFVDVVATSSHSHHHFAEEENEMRKFKYQAIEKGIIGQGYSRNNEEDEGENQKENEKEKQKQKMVSKLLEVGIIFHSVIIGVTMGMSQNRCTIQPLIAAVSVHQLFEGMGLGGCIAQAEFGVVSTIYMCLMFSMTTPLGIGLGMVIFKLTGYDENNPNTLISEGLLGSLSSGILLYMALVNLIAVDFFHDDSRTTMLSSWSSSSSGLSLKKYCYFALVLGFSSMSLLALWT